MQRLKTRAQYEAAMAGGTISRTAHFVLHRAPLDAPPAPTGPASPRTQALFDVQEAWMGAVVPKRWAKRAVTRNGIKRQIYNVSAAFEPGLAVAAHVVRLRAGFGRDEFKSAWSEPLKHAVRAELMRLFEHPNALDPHVRVRSSRGDDGRGRGDDKGKGVIPAQAGIQGSQQ